jgi:fibronectin type 3 domain-containing protein
LDIGGSQTLTAAVFPDNATDKTVYWASSHPNVATVENGKIIAVSGGSAIIRVSTKNGNLREDCVVVVTSKPANLKVAAFFGSQVDISWNEVKDAKSYNIYRNNSAEGTYAKLTNTTATNYRDSKPFTEDGKYNYYIISAVYEKEREGPQSGFATGPRPDQPKGLGLTKYETYIYLSWNSVSSADKYFVYRSNSSTSNYDKVNATTINYGYDNNPSKGSNFYKVTAVNLFGESDQSDYREVVVSD